MSPLKRISLIFSSLAIVLVLLSCSLIPQGITDLIPKGIGDLISRPTDTAAPTATQFRLPTATPLPELSLYGCPFSSDCGDAANLFMFYTNGDRELNKQYYVQIPHDAPVRVGIGWTAIDQATLEQNLQHMHFVFELDGQDYLADWMLKDGVAVDENDSSITYPTRFMGVALSDWKVGYPHSIKYGFVIDEPINDGWEDYQPQSMLHLFLAMPMDFATATPEPTERPLPTWTPKPVIYYTPQATSIPPTEASSCEVDSTIEILNSTGAAVNLFLTGPASYNFNLDTGENVINVCSGTYSYTGYGCGGSHLNGEIHSGDSRAFICD